METIPISVKERWKKVIENYYDYTIDGDFVKLRDADGKVIEVIHINGLINGFLENIANALDLNVKGKYRSEFD